jgi:hypothetical protein
MENNSFKRKQKRGKEEQRTTDKKNKIDLSLSILITA